MPKTIFTDANQAVVEVVKAARLSANLRQVDLATRMGKDQSWMSLVEGSQRRLDVVEFIKIAQALGIEPTALLAEVVRKLR
ncbi:helix-turn-helix transcriptional regulator [Sphingomonas sp. AP4-R1]|uniref:helix-turn-helix domain-containing protein n=1 Tax=Sphingomonas sp. AP4-R1 TaxID=2735134 RepID=UPI001493BDEE|nr:helix-turn-helix transcriptional regulator [Sphingomonas sp. AP4-R1]QJU60284.1 helix-turn-helix transcriptional regulator [Sphingomonas sp. AP4-R1]